jgi:hypothetical protein
MTAVACPGVSSRRRILCRTRRLHRSRLRVRQRAGLVDGARHTPGDEAVGQAQIYRTGGGYPRQCATRMTRWSRRKLLRERAERCPVARSRAFGAYPAPH